MQRFIVQATEKKEGISENIATVYSFLNVALERKNPVLTARKLARQVPHIRMVRFAGFATRRWLAQSLLENMFGRTNIRQSRFTIHEETIFAVLGDALRSARHHLTNKPLHIFLFPTFSTFVSKQMGGVSGYTPYKNILILFLSPQVNRHWKRALTETLNHEYVHAVMDNFYTRQNLLDDLIFEGVAEYFVVRMFGLKKHMPAAALSKRASRQWFTKLAGQLEAKDLYYSVFLEGTQYPLWGGYAIGYQIIESFMKKYPRITFDKLVRIAPQAIFKKSGFLE